MLAKILNVNDDPVSLYTTSKMLRRADFEVIEASSGVEALALVRSHRPEVAVLDVRMPDISGFEVCRRIKADPATASVSVLLTSAAFVTADSRVQGLNEGADAYLVQPAEPIELVATVRSLLRARRAEEQLSRLYERERAARQQAEQANRLRDEFLAAVSHELRTPLQAILGWAHMLQGGVEPARLQKGLAVIERNARVQTQLIEDLLDVSRIIAGKLRLSRQWVSVAAVLEAARDSVQAAADARDVRVELDIDPATGLLLGDPDRLQQVFWNLLTNAVKFTPPGGQIRVQVRRVEGHVIAQVHDTGKGIDSSFLPFLFEPFSQGEGGPTRSFGGLGLGLAIVRHLVELHGGSVEAHSDGPGQGAVFTVRLPDRSDGLAQATAWPHHGEPPLDEVPSLRDVRVLVVEPEPDTRELTGLILEQAGAQVFTVASAAEAFEAVLGAQPQVLVAALHQPEEDGAAFLLRLRALAGGSLRSLPALAITSRGRAEDRRRALEAGYQLHLPKPIDPPTLLSSVARLVRWEQGFLR